MNFSYAYTPQIWFSVLTALLIIALAVYTFRRRSVPGALPFTFALLFAALWMIGTSLEIAAVESPAKVFWLKYQVALMLFSVTPVTCFLLEYAWPGRWLTRRNLILLSIPPLLFLGLILTNDFHHLIWRGFVVAEKATPLNAAGYWMLMACVYGLGVANLIILGWLFLRSPQHRWPVALMFAGQVAARVVFALGAIRVIQSNPDIDVIAFWFPIPVYLIALFGFRILDPLPLARQVAIDQMREGMLVVDRAGQVVSLNPTAERILGVHSKPVQGKALGELLPQAPDLRALLAEETAPSKTIEMITRSGGTAHCYEIDYSPLHDFRGLLIGRLLLFHDVTDQRRSQAQLLEQQRALATLNEREQLARELHDGLGQALAAAHLQASTAKLLLDRGEIAQVSECLQMLAETTLQAESDMREYLLGAQSVASVDQPFFKNLREYLKRFTRQYNLPVELSVLPELERRGLPQNLAIQLLRIIQEGLSNIRKHAHASRAQVKLEHSVSRLLTVVSDDGRGFDESAVEARHGEGFGLCSMRQRAEALGGALRIESNPGKGTRLVVEVPLEAQPEDTQIKGEGGKDGNE